MKQTRTKIIATLEKTKNMVTQETRQIKVFSLIRFKCVHYLFCLGLQAFTVLSGNMVCTALNMDKRKPRKELSVET